MLKPLVPKFRSDLSFRLRDIAEKQIPVKLKPIVGRLYLGKIRPIVAKFTIADPDRSCSKTARSCLQKW